MGYVDKIKNRETVTKIALITSKLYYVTDDPQYKKQAMKVCKTMYNSEELSEFLKEVDHPAGEGGPIEQTNSQVIVEMNSNIVKSKAVKLAEKLTTLENDEDFQNACEIEFETIVQWITDVEPRTLV